MHLRFLRPGLALGLCLAAFSAQAQSLQTPLAQAFEQLRALQPEALAAGERRAAAQARQQQAQAWWADAPTLELSAKTDRLNRNAGSREWEAGVSAPLWRPGERGLSQALAGAELGAVGSSLAASQWRLAGSLREAWWTWQLARQDHALSQQRQATAALLAQDVQRRLAAGDLARADGHQAQAALAAAQAEAALAAGTLAQAEQGLRVLGLTLGLATDPQTGSAAEALPPPDAAPPTHPALLELADRAALAQQARDLAAMQKRANPALRLSSTRERSAFDQPYGQTLTLGLSIPLGSDGAYRAKLAAAQAEQIEAQALLTRLGQQQEAELSSARALLLAAQSAAEATALRAQLAQETLGFFSKSFQAGQSDLPTRLRVAQEAFEAQRQQARAQLQVSRAISALRQALGLLPQ